MPYMERNTYDSFNPTEVTVRGGFRHYSAIGAAVKRTLR